MSVEMLKISGRSRTVGDEKCGIINYSPRPDNAKSYGHV